MTLAEFKAMLKGVALARKGPPDEEQWQAILEELEKVEEGSASRPAPSAPVTAQAQNDIPQGPPPDGGGRWI